MKYLIWDFEGTLGYREGGFSSALIEIIHEETKETNITKEDIRPFLKSGFPWHTPDKSHQHLKTADEWWMALNPVFQRAFSGLGFNDTRAKKMAERVRSVFSNPQKWHLYEDTLETLEALIKQGWQHVILSNCHPELRETITYLSLDSIIVELFSSAEIGFEKPHPSSFQTVLDFLDYPEKVWMIGDNINADIRGAEAIGLPAILVRKYSPDAKYYCENLSEISFIVNSD